MERSLLFSNDSGKQIVTSGAFIFDSDTVFKLLLNFCKLNIPKKIRKNATFNEQKIIIKLYIF